MTQDTEIEMLRNRIRQAELMLKELRQKNDALHKAFIDLLETSVEYRERMGLDNQYFELDYMEKAQLL
jgi:vacuolar-type H+-ATPase subunit D/Vma8